MVRQHEWRRHMPRKHKLASMKMASGYWMARDEKAQGLWMWALGYLMSQMTHTVVI